MEYMKLAKVAQALSQREEQRIVNGDKNPLGPPLAGLIFQCIREVFVEAEIEKSKEHPR